MKNNWFDLKLKFSLKNKKSLPKFERLYNDLFAGNHKAEAPASATA